MMKPIRVRAPRGAAVGAPLLMVVVICAWSGRASSQSTFAPVPSGETKWGGCLGMMLLRGEVSHDKMEGRLAAFQDDTNIPAQWPLGFLLGVRYDRSQIELEWSVGFGSRLDFMDDDHFFEVQMTDLFLWYRHVIGMLRGAERPGSLSLSSARRCSPP